MVCDETAVVDGFLVAVAHYVLLQAGRLLGHSLPKYIRFLPLWKRGYEITSGGVCVHVG